MNTSSTTAATVITIGERLAQLESKLRSIAYSFSNGNQMEADDIYQTICEKLLTQVSASDTDAMILTRAKWRAAHYRKAQITYTLYVGDESDVAKSAKSDEEDTGDVYEFYQSDLARTTEDDVINREELAAINAAVEKLSIENKKILTLLAAGYNQRQISKKLGVSPSAIRQRLDGIVFKLTASGLSPA